MGTPTPPPPISGDDCGLCFPAGQTPLFVPVQVTGVVICPCALHDAPSGFYTLKQSDVAPCIWEYEDAWHQMHLAYSSGLSRFWIRDADDHLVRYFWNDVATECHDNFTNDYSECVPPFQCGYNGNVILV